MYTHVYVYTYLQMDVYKYVQIHISPYVCTCIHLGGTEIKQIKPARKQQHA